MRTIGGSLVGNSQFYFRSLVGRRGIHSGVNHHGRALECIGPNTPRPLHVGAGLRDRSVAADHGSRHSIGRLGAVTQDSKLCSGAGNVPPSTSAAYSCAA